MDAAALVGGDAGAPIRRRGVADLDEADRWACRPRSRAERDIGLTAGPGLPGEPDGAVGGGGDDRVAVGAGLVGDARSGPKRLVVGSYRRQNTSQLSPCFSVQTVTIPPSPDAATAGRQTSRPGPVTSSGVSALPSWKLSRRT